MSPIGVTLYSTIYGYNSSLNDDDLRLLWRTPDGRAVGGDAGARAEPIVRAAATPDAERDHAVTNATKPMTTKPAI
jgi:hypothetical protein